GHLTIADRDIVELSNLQRQVLFDEEDAQQALPKAIAATQRLSRINSSVVIEPLVIDVHAGNVEELTTAVWRGRLSDRDANAAATDLVLDGTDNIETRYLINDACVKHAIPWIY